MAESYRQRKAPPGSNRTTQGLVTPHQVPTSDGSLQPYLAPYTLHPGAPAPSHNPNVGQYESPARHNAQFISSEGAHIGQSDELWQTSSSNDTGYASLPTSSINLSTSNDVPSYFFQFQGEAFGLNTFLEYPMEPSNTEHGNLDDPEPLHQPVEGSYAQYVPAQNPVLSEPPNFLRPSKRQRVQSNPEDDQSAERASRPSTVIRSSRRHTSRRQQRAASSRINRTEAFSPSQPQAFRGESGGQLGSYHFASSLATAREPRPLSTFSAQSVAVIRSVVDNIPTEGPYPSREKIDALSVLTELPAQDIDSWIKRYVRNSSLRGRPAPIVGAFSRRGSAQLPPPSADDADLSGRAVNEHLPEDVRQAIEKYIQSCSRKHAKGDGRRKVNRGRYACTADCGYRTKRPFDWRRHEETHQPQEFWLCNICRFGTPPKMVLFGRRDKLLQHIKSDHPDQDADEIVAGSKEEYVTDFKRLCGFCGHRFVSWDSRNTHIIAHFDGKLEGGVRNITEWRDPWFEDESENEDECGDSPGSSDDGSDSDEDYHDDQGGPAGAPEGSGTGFHPDYQQPPANSNPEGQGGDQFYPGQMQFHHDGSAWFLKSSSVEGAMSSMEHVSSKFSVSLAPAAVSPRRADSFDVDEFSKASRKSQSLRIRTQRNHPNARCILPTLEAENQEKALSIPQNTGGFLGKGAYGSVDVVENRVTKQLYARKRCHVSPGNLSQLKSRYQEVRIMKMLSHPHIVSLVSAFVQDSGLDIIMSPLAHCTLRQYLDRPTKDQEHTPRIHSWFGCLSSALSFLHTKQVRHGDIKPQNLLIRDSDVFVSDFGISRIVSEENSTSSSISPMTPLYAPLEIAEHLPHGRKADIFSFGCVVLEMLTVAQGYTVADLHHHLGISISRKRPRSHPAYYKEQKGLFSWIERLRSRATRPTQHLWDICQGMLSNSVGHRPSSSVLVERLRQLLLIESPGSLPECLKPSVTPGRSSTSPPPASVPSNDGLLASHVPRPSFPCRPSLLKANSKSLSRPQPFYNTPPTTPSSVDTRRSSPRSTLVDDSVILPTSLLSASEPDTTKVSWINFDESIAKAEMNPWEALRLYFTIPTAAVCLMPSDSGRLQFLVSFMVLPMVLLSQNGGNLVYVISSPSSPVVDQTREHNLESTTSCNDSRPFPLLPPRRESSRIEVHKGGAIRMMDRKTCHLCGRLFTAPWLSQCRKCGHKRCKECPERRHEVLQKKPLLDQDPDLTEIGSHLSPPAYSVTDTTAVLEDQYVFDKIVGQSQAIRYPKENFLQASPSTFDLMQVPLEKCQDEWWSPQTPSEEPPGFIESRALSEASLQSPVQPAHKRLRIELDYVDRSRIVSTAQVGMDLLAAESGLSVGQATIDRPTESPDSAANNHAFFSRIQKLRKAPPSPGVAESSFKNLPRIMKSASTSTNNNDAVARLPIIPHTRSISCDRSQPDIGSKIPFLRRSLSNSQDRTKRPAISPLHLDVGPTNGVSESSASVKSTGSFRRYGRHANSWIFNDYSFTGGAKKMYKFLAGGKGTRDAHECS